MSSLIQFGTLPLARKDEILIVYDNRLLGRKGCLVTADSEAPEGNHPAANLLSEDQADYWRSDSVLTRSMQPDTNFIVKFALGTPRDVDWVGYGWSNNNLPWAQDLYMGDPDLPGSTLLGTTGSVHPIVRSTLLDFDYDDFPWYLGPTDERILEMANDFQLQSFYHFPSVLFGVDHVVASFDAAEGENLNRDFVQVGMMTAGRSFQPTFNVSLGVEIKPVFMSDKHLAADGASQGTTRRTLTELSFVLDHLTNEEALTRIFTDWVRREGDLANVFVYLEPAAEMRLHFYEGGSFVGTLSTFEGIAIDEVPGDMTPHGAPSLVYVAKNSKGITILEQG